MAQIRRYIYEYYRDNPQLGTSVRTGEVYETTLKKAEKTAIRHCVRIYHWMYTHGHHKKYAQIFDDGLTFKRCYESMIEKYEFEFEPFDISLELKKYKINKRKRELENDFDC